MYGQNAIEMSRLVVGMACLLFAAHGIGQEMRLPQVPGGDASGSMTRPGELPPESVLLEYANETEREDTFSKQFASWEARQEPLQVSFQNRSHWYWSSYGFGRSLERRLLQGEALASILEITPKDLHETLRREDKLQREARAKDKEQYRLRMFGGRYAKLNGDPVLWAILDRTKPLAAHQGLYFPRISSWPSDAEVFVWQGVHISELTSLKVLAASLLLMHWADEPGVVDELLRRYDAIKPATKEELIFKEQIRAGLKKWQADDVRVRALPDVPLNSDISSLATPSTDKGNVISPAQPEAEGKSNEAAGSDKTVQEKPKSSAKEEKTRPAKSEEVGKSNEAAPAATPDPAKVGLNFAYSWLVGIGVLIGGCAVVAMLIKGRRQSTKG